MMNMPQKFSTEWKKIGLPTLTLALILTLGAGCASKSTQRELDSDASVSAQDESVEYANEELEGLIEEVETEIENPLTQGQYPTLGEIHLELNRNVEKWIHYFSVKDKERFTRFLERGKRYRRLVQDILKENDLPPDLYYLALIESGYSTHARSHASATGAWQFMKGTAKDYGLQVDTFSDERRDPIRATEAAARFLRDLYNDFRSWNLALAAYNAGKRRIEKAVVRGKSSDYWELANNGFLPNETKNYVPKFIAAVIIGRRPEKFGFKDIQYEEFPDVEALSVPSPVRINDLAKKSRIPASTLKALNPHLLQGMTPPNRKEYEVWIPTPLLPQARSIVAELKPLARKTLIPVRRIASADTDEQYHRVRAGDSLTSLAKRYHVTLRYLKKLNGLRSSQIYAGQRLRIKANAYHPASVAQRKSPSKSTLAKRKSTYRVRKGDTLTHIAGKFQTSVKSLKKENQIKANQIFVGQWVRIPKED